MKRHRILPTGSAGALLVASVTILSAQDVPTFRAAVFLVHVDAEVVSRDGRPLTGLTKDDFRILDDGREQAITAFSEGEQPLDLILLFDISGSMRRQVKKVAAVAHEGFEELRAGDRVAVMVFNTNARVVAPFSDDLEAVSQAIEAVLDLRFRGGTRIIASIDSAADQFTQSGDREHPRRRAVLVITDNMGLPSFHKQAILEKLWEADALVSGLVVVRRGPTAAPGPSGLKPWGGIDDLVEKTGGDMLRASDLSVSFPEMMHRLRTRYTLYYRLPEADVGSVRSIDVQLSQQGRERFPGARMIARRAYRLQERDRYGFASR